MLSISSILSRSLLQSLSQPRRRVGRETEAAKDTDDIHIRTTEGVRTRLPRDPLPGHLHPRGDCHEDRPDRSSSTGKFNIAPGDCIKRRFAPCPPVWLSACRFVGAQVIPVGPSEICLIGLWHVGCEACQSVMNCNGNGMNGECNSPGITCSWRCIIKHVTAGVQIWYVWSGTPLYTHDHHWRCSLWRTWRDQKCTNSNTR